MFFCSNKVKPSGIDVKVSSFMLLFYLSLSCKQAGKQINSIRQSRIVYNGNMRVPVYEELIFKSTDVMTVIDTIRKSRVGKGPTYLNMQPYELNQHHEVLSTLIEALKILKLSAYFPYPLYIISQHRLSDVDLPFLDDEKSLPAHFHNKIKRLNSRELDLSHKISTLTDRISNQPVETRRKELKKTMVQQRHLFHLTKEQAFYENVIQKLNRVNNEQ